MNAIKVVVAFGQEPVEMKNYGKYLGRAKATGIKTHLKSALTLGFFFFIIFGYYSYAFYLGTMLITQPKPKYPHSDEEAPDITYYNGGDIISCFFGVVFGVFSLALATPNIKALVEGKIAGKMAYDIIDKVPTIKLDDAEAKHFQLGKGKIEFKNVTYSYATRKE